MDKYDAAVAYGYALGKSGKTIEKALWANGGPLVAYELFAATADGSPIRVLNDGERIIHDLGALYEFAARVAGSIIVSDDGKEVVVKYTEVDGDTATKIAYSFRRITINRAKIMREHYRGG